MIAILLYLLKAHCGTEYSHKSVTGGKKTTTTTTKPKHNYSSLCHVNLKADCGGKNNISMIKNRLQTERKQLQQRQNPNTIIHHCAT